MKLFKFIFGIGILGIFLISSVFAQELIVDFESEESVVTVNDELRKTNENIKDNAADISAINSVPAGSMTIWTTDTAPTGWLLCYGQAISRTTYATLFAVVSTTYGVGNGSTTFNVPDMRGRLPLGQDDMGGSSANVVTEAEADSLGGTEGDEDGVAAHTHPITEQMYSEAGATTDHIADGGNSAGATLSITTDSTGDATAGNMPPYITLNYIIKT